MTTIQPTGLQSIIQHLKPAQETNNSTETSFTSLLQKMVGEVQESQAAVEEGQLLIATGQSDDLHSVMIDAAKAELSLSMLLQIRNKALDAYNEIMNITM